MEVNNSNRTDGGSETQARSQNPDIEKILYAVRQREQFAEITRYKYDNYDIGKAMKAVEAIGKMRNPKFVIDDENRFTYENFIRWCHGDPTMKALNPENGKVVNGRLKRGIYIAGNSGTGKSWCLEIMLAYSLAYGFKVKLVGNTDYSPLYWRTERADSICEQFAESGNIQTFRRQPILAIQDLGNETEETLYMGNRVDVIRQILNYRGDMTDEITLATSNFKINGEPFLNRYGDKVVSRAFEMFNYFEMKGRDRRKI